MQHIWKSPTTYNTFYLVGSPFKSFVTKNLHVEKYYIGWIKYLISSFEESSLERKKFKTRKSSYVKTQEAYRPHRIMPMACPIWVEGRTPVLVRARGCTLSWLGGVGRYPCPRTRTWDQRPLSHLERRGYPYPLSPPLPQKGPRTSEQGYPLPLWKDIYLWKQYLPNSSDAPVMRIVCTHIFVMFVIMYNAECRMITARIRSMTGRYCFHRCLSVNILGGGTWS